MHEKIIFLFLLINIPVFLFYEKIVKKININDTADGIRKFRRGKIPLLGGSWLIYNIIFLEKRGMWSQKCQRSYKIVFVGNFVSIMTSQRQTETHFFL